MKHTRNKLRATILALSASIVLPTAPVFGQDAPVVTVAPPPPVVTAPPAPAPVLRTTPAPTPRLQIAIPEADPAPARAARTARAAPRASAPARRAAPARAPAATPAPAAAPAPAPAAAPAAPVAQTLPPPPAEIPAPVAPAAETADSGGIGALLPWIIGGILLVAAAAFFLFGRRRRRDEVYDETYDEEPVVAAEPGFARAPVAETPYVAPVEPAPIIAAAPAAETLAAAREVEEPEVVEADEADVEALTESAAPVDGRPWLEFLMRPVRAGTSQDDAIVQFELTVGNTGTVAAQDVRISTWMVAAGEGTDMERSLIEAPADAQVSEVDIAAGDGARVEAEHAVSKAGLGDAPVLPVVVADARYRLPDGSEGRTHAAFAIGMQGEDEELSPFPTDRASGLRENVEARLHGEPERV